MKIEGWHRQHAILMASNLPNGIEDTRIVLKLLNDLVENFLASPEPETKRAIVTRFKVVD
jgi:hypothetical protein